MAIGALGFHGLLSSPPPVATAPAPVEIPVISFPPTWQCEDCSPEEQYVLAEIQEHTKISDRNALATILGNIKQESNFRANVCEGGETEFLTAIVIGVGMALFSGLARSL